jgi:ABC-type lipoprotein export system ATPase subunit
MIQLENVYKQYLLGELALQVLKGISLHIKSAEFVAIMGASGSGKTTLLNIIGCLDTLDSGSYRLANESVQTADDDQLAQLRSQHIGFVFQSFNLIPRINAWRNVEIPMIYRNIPSAERRIRALAALERIGIGDRAEHLPAQLSGGQQQRVAIARALVNSPQVLVADEPTGSLDSQNSKEIMQLFQTLNAAGMTIVMVTHERDIADQAKRIITLHDGLIIA